MSWPQVRLLWHSTAKAQEVGQSDEFWCKVCKAGEIIHVKVTGKRKQVLSCDPSELSHWLGAAGQNMAVA